LLSVYREIPVHRLLIGDGGCIDNSIEIAKQFPRVVVYDHKKYVSLGYSLKKLIENVSTEWFVYLHSDVYLPEGWFEAMQTNCSKYDWFGCPQRITVMAEYPNVDKVKGIERPYAGSQMGRKAAFIKGIETIDDDYVYRQEDFVFSELVQRSGGRVGKVQETFHYHQVMHRISGWVRKIKGVAVDVDWSKEEKLRSDTTLIKGCIKYLSPSPLYFSWIVPIIVTLLDTKQINMTELKTLARTCNPDWLPYLKFWRIWFWRKRSYLWPYNLAKRILEKSGFTGKKKHEF
jgi:glycosyltransferase involved in cell wall biosynthesis